MCEDFRHFQSLLELVTYHIHYIYIKEFSEVKNEAEKNMRGWRYPLSFLNDDETL